MPAEIRVPLDVAHEVLATFGITEPTAKYDRWVKPDGFEINDFHDVLADSRFVFGIDWRAVLSDELKPIAAAISELGVRVEIEVAEDANDGWITCGGQREYVKYVPSDDDDFTDVVVAMQTILPSTIEFRAAISNGFNDGWEFAVLLADEWSALEAIDSKLISLMFCPLR